MLWLTPRKYRPMRITSLVIDLYHDDVVKVT
jgi:hypothetical protein